MSGQAPRSLLRWIALAAPIFLFVSAAAQQTKQLPGIRPILGSDESRPVTPHQLHAPTKARSAVEKAQKAMLEGKTDEAYKQVSRALDAYPDYSIALATRGILNLNAGKTAEASVDFQNAIQADPDYGPPYVVLGALYNHAHRYNDALLVLTRALRLIPTAWQVHFEMGQALFGKGGEDTAALSEMTDAVRMISDGAAPEDRASVHFWRAHVLVQLKDFSAARSEYMQVIHEQPDGRWAGFAREALRLVPSRTSLAVAEPVGPADGNVLSDP